MLSKPRRPFLLTTRHGLLATWTSDRLVVGELFLVDYPRLFVWRDVRRPPFGLNDEDATLNSTAEANTIVESPKRWPHLAVWAGLLIITAGAISYFLYFAQFPSLRDFPLLNLPIVLIGLGVALVGAFKVFRQGSGLAGKVFAILGVLLSVAITGLFNFYVFSFSFQLPDAAAAPSKQEAAPDFTLLDHTGQPVSLADYRGHNVILVFYRGFW